jgi:hypothetical protein
MLCTAKRITARGMLNYVFIEGERWKRRTVNIVRVYPLDTQLQEGQEERMFQLALPPKKHRKLRLSPALILQVQELSDVSRPRPLLDILRPSIFMTGKFYGFPKPAARDIYVTQREPYVQSTKEVEQKIISPGSESDENDDCVIAMICRTNSKAGKADVLFRGGQHWTAMTLSPGEYQFFDVTSTDGSTVACWKRQNRVRFGHVGDVPGDLAVNGGAAATFVFEVNDQKARETSTIAAMTQQNVRIFDLNHRCRTYPISSHDMSDSDRRSKCFIARSDENIISLALISGVWVALQEGWVNE